jgi:hypothetical protein
MFGYIMAHRRGLHFRVGIDIGERHRCLIGAQVERSGAQIERYVEHPLTIQQVLNVSLN